MIGLLILLGIALVMIVALLTAMLVHEMSGSYSNIVGLALYETAQLLHGAGFRW